MLSNIYFEKVHSLNTYNNIIFSNFIQRIFIYLQTYTDGKKFHHQEEEVLEERNLADVTPRRSARKTKFAGRFYTSKIIRLIKFRTKIINVTLVAPTFKL